MYYFLFHQSIAVTMFTLDHWTEAVTQLAKNATRLTIYLLRKSQLAWDICFSVWPWLLPNLPAGITEAAGCRATCPGWVSHKDYAVTCLFVHTQQCADLKSSALGMLLASYTPRSDACYRLQSSNLLGNQGWRQHQTSLGATETYPGPPLRKFPGLVLWAAPGSWI